MTDAGEALTKIVRETESNLKLPKGALRDIYESELMELHKDVRTSFIEKTLRQMVMEKFEEYNEN